MPKLANKKPAPKPSANGKPAKASINKIAPALKSLTVPIDTLTPDPMNARTHGKRNMEAIRASLALYGQVKPVVVRAATRVVVAGNGTLAAAKELGWTYIAASVVDMTATEAIGYGLADNRTAELAAWDFEVVKKLDTLLQEADHEMTGWSLEELAVLRRSDWTPAENQTAELQETWKVVVDCADEAAQVELLEKLMAEGYTCQALTF